MKKRIIFICACICVLVLLIIPYVKVEILTFLHEDEFTNLSEDIAMIDGIEYYKVMEYTEDEAQVLCVSEGHGSTNLCRYEKRGNSWRLDEWECIWSKTGSADSFIWPLYR